METWGWMKVHGSFVILDINNKRCTDARNIFKVDIGKTSSPHDCSGPQVLRCCIMNYGSVHISHIWCVILWRGDRQCFLPCGPCHISIHVLFLTNFSLWGGTGSFCISNDKPSLTSQTKSQPTSGPSSLTDNVKKQSNTTPRLTEANKEAPDC